MTVTAELVHDQVLAGTYRIERLLGRGGMGAVYQAEHLRTRKQVALKTLRPGFGKIREIAKRFEREALTTSLLSHPGVVKVDDYGELEDGALFLVMELVPGASLREIIDEGEVPAARAFAIVRQVLDALIHAHAQGVIHRDLKPDNVKVAPDRDHDAERVKILDFGIAKVVGLAEEVVGAEKLTEAGIAFGTPDYMAPEQALGQAVDGRADLYSLAVMLFEMLAGRRPFISDEAIAVARMHVAAPLPTLAQVAPGRRFTPATEALLARALAKRPSERFADAVEMTAALDVAAAAEAEAAAGEPSGTSTPAPVPVVAAGSTPTRRPPTARPATPVPLRGERDEAAAQTAPLLRRARTGLDDVRTRLARLSTRQRLAAGAAVVTLALVVLIVTLPGGSRSGSSRSTRSGGALPALTPGAILPVEQSPLAREALALVDAGKADEARTRLLAGLRAPGGERDASAHLALGAAQLALDQPLEALSVFELGVAIDPSAARDERTQKAVLELAARGKTWKLRQRATEVAARMGVQDRIDRFDAALLDLAQAPSCPERRDALLALRKLKDARALPAFKRARGRRSGFFGTGRPNSCLEKDAADAIAELEPPPP